jgi:nitroreductase
MDAILTRRSVGKVKLDAVPRRLIEKLLHAAVQAPNHKRVRPWRFVVITGKSREALGEVMANSLKGQDPLTSDSLLDLERTKTLRAPLLIAAGVDKPAEPQLLEIENICAVAAALENLLLAAHAQGLGAKWRTVPSSHTPAVKKFLGFSEDQELLGIIYIGYPDLLPNAEERPSYEDRTTWME